MRLSCRASRVRRQRIRGAGLTWAFGLSRTLSYAEAVSDFQKAVDLEPNNLNAHLYLGTAYMTQFIPGDNSVKQSGDGDKSGR